ncbi:hypothetical protein OHB35_13545 [Streptomyces phaeochromogenes]|uniref:Uncharacterized protein n=1 Tax=Streptomyces phaeochromogenes TaxID=1923 RepID=A0ABZ1H9G6_STRPH|nr:hypothetical protein [Streptomyces phaeochromogenes]WSD14186.1 hypothetical protein OHB35_13545 [Streptomyces phaeochromogenes]
MSRSVEDVGVRDAVARDAAVRVTVTRAAVTRDADARAAVVRTADLRAAVVRDAPHGRTVRHPARPSTGRGDAPDAGRGARFHVAGFVVDVQHADVLPSDARHVLILSRLAGRTLCSA